MVDPHGEGLRREDRYHHVGSTFGLWKVQGPVMLAQAPSPRGDSTSIPSPPPCPFLGWGQRQGAGTLVGTEPNLLRTSRSQPVTYDRGGAGRQRRDGLLSSPGGRGEQVRRKFMRARQGWDQWGDDRGKSRDPPRPTFMEAHSSDWCSHYPRMRGARKQSVSWPAVVTGP